MKKALILFSIMTMMVLACKGQVLSPGMTGAQTRTAINTAFSETLAVVDTVNETIRINGISVSAGAAEINVLHGATLNTAELNTLDGVLATYLEINRLVGVTSAIQTQLNARINRADSTGGAVGNYVTRKALADTTTNKSSRIVRDSIADYLDRATLAVSLADSNIVDGGYPTITYIQSLIGSGEGMSTKRLPFIIGTTAGAPSASDSTITHSEFSGKHINLYRDGALQYQNSTATNTVEGFRLNSNVITVNPVWQAGEQVLIDITDPVLWSSLSIEGEESTLLTGLSGYWKLDETSGTTVNDATATQNGTTTATINVEGKLGRAYEYDAASDIITIPYNTNISPKGTAFSVSIWFKIDSLPTVTGRGNYLMQVGHNASPYLAHSIEVRNDDNRVYVRSRNASETLYTVMSSGTISVDTWYHVVFVNRGDGQTLQLYLNGSDVSSSAGTFTGTIFEGLYQTCFGNAYSGAPSSYLDGTLDSFGIWSRALTSGEVTTLYNSGNGRTYPFN